jgi:hypothetical protein
MTHFRLAPHISRSDHVVEIWRDGKFIGALYARENGVRLVFPKYLERENVEIIEGQPTVLEVKLDGRA